MSRQDEEWWERLERYRDDGVEPLDDATLEELQEQERETQRDAERWRQKNRPDTDQPRSNDAGAGL